MSLHYERKPIATFDVPLNANTRYLVTAYTGTQKPLRIVVTDAANPSAIIDTTVHVADGPLAVVEVPDVDETATVAVVKH